MMGCHTSSPQRLLLGLVSLMIALTVATPIHTLPGEVGVPSVPSARPASDGPAASTMRLQRRSVDAPKAVFCVLVDWSSGAHGVFNLSLAALRAAAVDARTRLGAGSRVAFEPCRVGTALRDPHAAAAAVKRLAVSMPQLVGIVQPWVEISPAVTQAAAEVGLLVVAPQTLDAALFDRARLGSATLHVQNSIECDINVLLRYAVHSHLRCQRFLIAFIDDPRTSVRPKMGGWAATIRRLGLPEPVIVQVSDTTRLAQEVATAALAALAPPQCYVIPLAYASVVSVAKAVAEEPRLGDPDSISILAPSIAGTFSWPTVLSKAVPKVFTVSTLPPKSHETAMVIDAFHGAMMAMFAEPPSDHYGLQSALRDTPLGMEAFVAGRAIMEAFSRVDVAAFQRADGRLDRRKLLVALSGVTTHVAVEAVVFGPFSFRGCVGRQTSATGPCWCNSGARKVFINELDVASGVAQPATPPELPFERSDLDRIPASSCGMPQSAIQPTTAALVFYDSSHAHYANSAASQTLLGAMLSVVAARKALRCHDVTPVPVVADAESGPAVFREALERLVGDRYVSAFLIAPPRVTPPGTAPGAPAVTAVGAVPALPVAVLGEASDVWLLEDPVFVGSRPPDGPGEGPVSAAGSGGAGDPPLSPTVTATRSLPATLPATLPAGESVLPWNDHVIDAFPVMADLAHAAASFAARLSDAGWPESEARDADTDTFAVSRRRGARPPVLGENVTARDFYAGRRAHPVPVLGFADGEALARLVVRSAHTFGVDPAVVRLVGEGDATAGAAESSVPEVALPLGSLPPSVRPSMAAAAEYSATTPAAIVLVASQRRGVIAAAAALAERLPGAAVIVAGNEFSVDAVRDFAPLAPAESPGGRSGTSSPAGQSPGSLFFTSAIPAFRGDAFTSGSSAAQYGRVLGALAAKAVAAAHREAADPGRIVSHGAALAWLYGAGAVDAAGATVGPLARGLCNPAAGSSGAPWRTPKTARCQCKKAFQRFHVLRWARPQDGSVHTMAHDPATCGVAYAELLPPDGGVP